MTEQILKEELENLERIQRELYSVKNTLNTIDDEFMCEETFDKFRKTIENSIELLDRIKYITEDVEFVDFDLDNRPIF